MVSVLIADDSLFMRKFERQSLTGAGYKVVGEATNGDEAVALCRELKPDLVSLDIVMAGGAKARNGLDALADSDRMSFIEGCDMQFFGSE